MNVDALARHPESLTLASQESPSKGERNSSFTRVRPVFQALLDNGPSGRTWLPTILRLRTRSP